MSRDGLRHDLKPHVGSIVKVTWTDAACKSEWITETELVAMKLPTIISVGWLVNVDQDALKMAADRDVEDEQYNLIGIIPLGWIKSVERLHGEV